MALTQWSKTMRSVVRGGGGVAPGDETSLAECVQIGLPAIGMGLCARQPVKQCGDRDGRSRGLQ